MNKEPFKVALSVDGMSMTDEILDNHLAVIEVYVCHDGNNAHNLPIGLDVIKNAQETLKNKPLVAGFDGRDFEGHEIDEVIIGYFPESSNMKYVEKNGKTYLVAEAVMPKNYARWAYDIFKKQNTKSVSMEIEVYDFEEIDEELTAIKKFMFNAVTVLGETHIPACEGANATMFKFSKEDAFKAYEKHLTSQSIKSKYLNSKFEEKIAVEDDDTTYMGDAIKINNKKEDTVNSDSWKNPEAKLYKPILEASNKESLVKEAYLIVEEGYEDAPSEKLKYPHHNIKGSELVLNVQGVIAAFQRASQQGIVKGDIKEHLLRHYRELGLSTENFEIEEEGGKAMSEEIENKAAEEEMEKEVSEEVANEAEVAETETKEFEAECKDEEKMEDDSEEKDSEEKDNEEENSEEEKMEELPADEKEEEKDSEEEKYSFEQIKAIEAENAELKEKLNKYEEAEKANEVECTLSSVKEFMSQEEMDSLREESKNYSLDEIDAFKNKVKAAAFERIGKVTKEEVTFTRMAITETAKTKPNGLW